MVIDMNVADVEQDLARELTRLERVLKARS
jgi:hypothetical protein